jgi:hypothetical protein
MHFLRIEVSLPALRTIVVASESPQMTSSPSPKINDFLSITESTQTKMASETDIRLHIEELEKRIRATRAANRSATGMSWNISATSCKLTLR